MNNRQDQTRYFFAFCLTICIFILLLGRYFYLQTKDHNVLLKQSVDNYTSAIVTAPVRGLILDRNNVPLVKSSISYSVGVLKKNVGKNSSNVIDQLRPLISITATESSLFRKKISKSKPYDIVSIKSNLTDKEIAILATNMYKLDGFYLTSNVSREYIYDDLYAHAIGYVSRLSQTDKDKMSKINPNGYYLSNDYIGKNGIEYVYESYLRGIPGRKVIQTDAFGNEVNLLSNIPASDGNTVKLTLDHQLQQSISDFLGDRKGAVVALNPQTGAVLAFVSKPSYDPNLFIDGISPDDWGDLLNDKNKPLLNRAIQGTYPPGSTFKPFLGLAALQLNVRTPQWTMYDGGVFVIPGSTHEFRGDGSRALGTVNMDLAITKSSDVYFYKLGLDLGIDRADKILPYFSLGKKTGIDLPNELSGLLPSKEWKYKRFKNNPAQIKWQAADSVVFGIGQGFSHYTPLQMAHAVGIIANDGVSTVPHLLDKVISPKGDIIYQYGVESTTVPIEKKYFTLMKAAMQHVTEFGTARSFKSDVYTMAGKTGTAQVVGNKQGTRDRVLSGDKYKDHSWFIAFAPVDNPKIAIAVIVENGGYGASAAGPLAKQVLDYYLITEKNLYSEPK